MQERVGLPEALSLLDDYAELCRALLERYWADFDQAEVAQLESLVQRHLRLGPVYRSSLHGTTGIEGTVSSETVRRR